MHFSLPQVVRGEGREQSRSAGFQPAVSPISNRQNIARTLAPALPGRPQAGSTASRMAHHESRLTFPPSPNPNGVSHISPVVATLRRLASLPWVNRPPELPNPESGCIMPRCTPPIKEDGIPTALKNERPWHDAQNLFTFHVSRTTHLSRRSRTKTDHVSRTRPP